MLLSCCELVCYVPNRMGKSICVVYCTENQIVTWNQTIHSGFGKAIANIEKKAVFGKFFGEFFRSHLVISQNRFCYSCYS